jgi:hypothetical protein
MSQHGFTARIGIVVGAAVLAAAAAVAIAACGDSDATTTEDAAAPQEVTLTATEYAFDLSDTPGAETETVSFQNDGEEFHVLVFARINEGFTTEEAIKLEGEKGSAEVVGQAEAKPGQTKAVEIKGPLGPGNYAMLCPLQTEEGEAHYELGQLQEFELG